VVSVLLKGVPAPFSLINPYFSMSRMALAYFLREVVGLDILPGSLSGELQTEETHKASFRSPLLSLTVRVVDPETAGPRYLHLGRRMTLAGPSSGRRLSFPLCRLSPLCCSCIQSGGSPACDLFRRRP